MPVLRGPTLEAERPYFAQAHPKQAHVGRASSGAQHERDWYLRQ